MIATWMLSALLFTALLGAASYCAEAALRSAGRPTRWPWVVALVASVSWPLFAPFARRSDALQSVAITLRKGERIFRGVAVAIELSRA